MSKNWAGGSTRRWRTIRANVLLRDKGKGCRAHRDGWCDRAPGDHTCTDTQDVVHHTRGKAVTGDDPRYLVAACEACNGHIGDPTQHEDPPNKAVTKW
ncbi:hypothetical protein [Micromonospora sp. C41]|uniref:hypothetical protein n=1 Tax=Micromonospora sp. C41 TaxID=2824878 RepID=UPI001B363226|nr:hypothetical protein [Micromonospora sp. C41]MBQ1061322.1 hypothetical protein [Micromonospora sp. C41]